MVIDELVEFVRAFDDGYGLSLRFASVAESDVFEGAVIAVLREMGKRISGGVIALVSCHRPRSVWVCVCVPPREAARQSRVG